MFTLVHLFESSISLLYITLYKNKLTSYEGGDDEGQNHELEQPHEEFPWVGDVADGQRVELGRPEGEAEDDAEADPGEGDDEEEVLADPAPQRVLRHLQHLGLHLELAGLCRGRERKEEILICVHDFILNLLF